ncbi:hypothetical protein LPJ78_000819 [Coemansia sp. RSA 989]|nr:hypothetical protein BX667DRAFT_493868 [Coemansia mojavensis]KAJ1740450.1 hypothetical protein LPJ68_003765 [Coemansia sp. RSA 1086]KAJ1753845.1 hypothetical protein LPJ79_000132 [Coemansia sp. RSA 1821]KAJ1867584.1 hypothetical protein LPJ78_000819 [Coemansia sp. RSA 989]KAJ1875849.1 hypothetical protein LPJ55_000263 [Coemansia sp. RSA 990]KAJ2630445.1 hypothetical protein H4R22_002665 [Coemansia sp. RSA 1290]KAJ2653728.1 hypothetical protein IWW40_000012 [Coemansia sp. RSA 1250]KAJ26768
MAYTRPLGQTFNQLNLNMYRLPDGQRGALRTTSLALAREASREDGRSSDSNSYNPFKGIKRLYSGLRKHRRSRERSPDKSLRKFYSTPVRGMGSAIADSDEPQISGVATHSCKTTQPRRRRSSGNELSDSADSTTASSGSASPSRASKHVRFTRIDPKVIDTYSPEEYDRRVADPWEFLTREKRDQIREEMREYATHEMKINDVYNTNSSVYCTLCWRESCHCRALSKDIWRRAKSTSILRAGA